MTEEAGESGLEAAVFSDAALAYMEGLSADWSTEDDNFL